MSDDELRRKVTDITNWIEAHAIGMLTKIERDKMLRKLKACGLSIREIERVRGGSCNRGKKVTPK